jgi:hypothetical protein
MATLLNPITEEDENETPEGPIFSANPGYTIAMLPPGGVYANRRYIPSVREGNLSPYTGLFATAGGAEAVQDNPWRAQSRVARPKDSVSKTRRVPGLNELQKLRRTQYIKAFTGAETTPELPFNYIEVNPGQRLSPYGFNYAEALELGLIDPTQGFNWDQYNAVVPRYPGSVGNRSISVQGSTPVTPFGAGISMANSRMSSSGPGFFATVRSGITKGARATGRKIKSLYGRFFANAGGKTVKGPVNGTVNMQSSRSIPYTSPEGESPLTRARRTALARSRLNVPVLGGRSTSVAGSLRDSGQIPLVPMRTSSVPGIWSRLGGTIKRGATAAGRGIKRGATAAGRGIKRGAGAIGAGAKRLASQAVTAYKERKAKKLESKERTTMGDLYRLLEAERLASQATPTGGLRPSRQKQAMASPSNPYQYNPFAPNPEVVQQAQAFSQQVGTAAIQLINANIGDLISDDVKRDIETEIAQIAYKDAINGKNTEEIIQNADTLLTERINIITQYIQDQSRRVQRAGGPEAEYEKRKASAERKAMSAERKGNVGAAARARADAAFYQQELNRILLPDIQPLPEVQPIEYKRFNLASYRAAEAEARRRSAEDKAAFRRGTAAAALRLQAAQDEAVEEEAAEVFGSKPLYRAPSNIPLPLYNIPPIYKSNTGITNRKPSIRPVKPVKSATVPVKPVITGTVYNDNDTNSKIITDIINLKTHVNDLISLFDSLNLYIQNHKNDPDVFNDPVTQGLISLLDPDIVNVNDIREKMINTNRLPLSKLTNDQLKTTRDALRLRQIRMLENHTSAKTIYNIVKEKVEGEEE